MLYQNPFHLSSAVTLHISFLIHPTLASSPAAAAYACPLSYLSSLLPKPSFCVPRVSRLFALVTRDSRVSVLLRDDFVHSFPIVPSFEELPLPFPHSLIGVFCALWVVGLSSSPTSCTQSVLHRIPTRLARSCPPSEAHLPANPRKWECHPTIYVNLLLERTYPVVPSSQV